MLPSQPAQQPPQFLGDVLLELLNAKAYFALLQQLLEKPNVTPEQAQLYAGHIPALFASLNEAIKVGSLSKEHATEMFLAMHDRKSNALKVICEKHKENYPNSNYVNQFIVLLGNFILRHKTTDAEREEQLKTIKSEVHDRFDSDKQMKAEEYKNGKQTIDRIMTAIETNNLEDLQAISVLQPNARLDKFLLRLYSKKHSSLMLAAYAGNDAIRQYLFGLLKNYFSSKNSLQGQINIEARSQNNIVYFMWAAYMHQYDFMTAVENTQCLISMEYPNAIEYYREVVGRAAIFNWQVCITACLTAGQFIRDGEEIVKSLLWDAISTGQADKALDLINVIFASNPKWLQYSFFKDLAGKDTEIARFCFVYQAAECDKLTVEKRKELVLALLKAGAPFYQPRLGFMLDSLPHYPQLQCVTNAVDEIGKLSKLCREALLTNEKDLLLIQLNDKGELDPKKFSKTPYYQCKAKIIAIADAIPEVSTRLLKTPAVVSGGFWASLTQETPASLRTKLQRIDQYLRVQASMLPDSPEQAERMFMDDQTRNLPEPK